MGRALRATASPASVNQADGADTVEIPMGPRGGATVEAKRIWYHDPRSRGFNADGGFSGYDLPRGERVLADEFDGGVQKFVYLSPTPLSRASVPVDISSFTSRVRYTGQSEGYAIVQGDIPASALQRKQKQTDTAAFREWFGDSKVVGINAEPLVVYHGTANSFDELGFQPVLTRHRATRTSKDAGKVSAATMWCRPTCQSETQRLTT